MRPEAKISTSGSLGPRPKARANLKALVLRTAEWTTPRRAEFQGEGAKKRRHVRKRTLKNCDPHRREGGNDHMIPHLGTETVALGQHRSQV